MVKAVALLFFAGLFSLPAQTIEGYRDFAGISAPSNPSSGIARFYYNLTNAMLACLNPDGSSCIGPSDNQNLRSVGIIFDGGGVALGAQTRCTIVNIAGTIKGFTMISDVSGGATVDVQTVAYSSYTGPGAASSITDSHTPTMASAVKYQDTTLTGWTTSLSANTVVCFVLSSPSTVTWLNADLKIAASN